MLFTTIDFGIFIVFVFIIFWKFFNKSINSQNYFLLAVSLFFYGYWDYRFLGLLIFSILFNYYFALWISKNKTSKRYLLTIAIIVDLMILIFFKYFNFFVENFASVFTLFGKKIDTFSLNIIIPLGISFYTFQIIGSLIDIYRGKLVIKRDIVAFSLFFSFFPQIFSGPINRITNLLPQFQKLRYFNQEIISDGFRQILWGLFKKMVVADNCASVTANIFSNFSELSGIDLVLGILYFSIQIYADFSGYSDIAIGSAKLFNINLTRNFNYPYFSSNIAEFWKRWHISLSFWFRDYLFLPIAYSTSRFFIKLKFSMRRVEFISYSFGTTITFILVGFWHGPEWSFILWGGLNGIFLIFYNYFKRFNKNRVKKHILAHSKYIFLFNIIFTFILVSITWVFFKSENITESLDYFRHIIINPFLPLTLFKIKLTSFVILMYILEFVNRNKEFALDVSNIKNRFVRWSTYYIFIALIFYFSGMQKDFIYFKF